MYCAILKIIVGMRKSDCVLCMVRGNCYNMQPNKKHSTQGTEEHCSRRFLVPSCVTAGDSGEKLVSTGHVCVCA